MTHDAQLKQVFADIMETEVSEVGDDASVETIPIWDSYHHLNLVLALESEFGVTFTEEEVVAILSLAKIRDALQGHGVRFDVP